ncbi:MAG: anthranilate phosphoribosyltransferase, partial [Actinomycetota bacterium]|nr:anthranilate phosphoribosyltransferase [Actinomycetota bacterium]
ILRDVLSGRETGAARDVILLNAGAAVFVSGKAETIEGGVRQAEESIATGAAEGAREDFVRATRREAGTA